MNREKIAILTDSGSDVPAAALSAYPIYVLPLKVLFSDGEYTDGVNITAEAVYTRLPTEIPKTSLPGPETILSTLQRIQDDGYEKVLGVCMSSALSGTCNLVRLMCEGFHGLQTHVVDTRNISIGSGLLAVAAAQYAQQGMGWEDLVEKIEGLVPESKVFFCVKTLEYLQKGGRIGRVTALVGSALKLKPIISCNPEGIYYTAGKALGRKASIEKMLDLSARFAAGCTDVVLALMHGAAAVEAAALTVDLRKRIPQGRLLLRGQISPALGVHTGPGLLGVGILRKTGLQPVPDAPLH